MSYRPFTYGFPSGVLATLAALILAGGFYACEEPEEVNCLQDTTSHDFVWQIDTLGDSGVLSDVAIINDTLVYAVGEIYVKDSLGQWDPLAYGFAIWNGRKWVLRRFEAVGPTGSISSLRPRGILAFDIDDIWFASGGVFHWNGLSITPYWINDFPGNPNPILSDGQTAEKLWGRSNFNIYAVGRSGAIAHYDGTSWQRLASGTTLDIQDICGAKNNRSGETEILAIASSKYQNIGKKVFKIRGTTVTEVSNSGLPWSLSSIYFIPGVRYYIVGDGVFETSSATSSGTWELYPSGKMTQYYSQRIRGACVNDIFIVGDFGEIVHYNGHSWMNYHSQTGFGQGYYRSVALQENLAVAVGQCGNQAIAAIGRR